MAQTGTQLTPASAPKPQRSDAFFAWLLGAPAFAGLFIFLILPFFMAIALSFTNQRLLSPNPTEGVGVRNYDRLLAVNFLVLEPLVNEETGEVLVDEDTGEVQFPRSRDITRNTEEYPQYEGFREWFSVDAFGNRYVILAKDATFLRSILNNFLFAFIVVPLQSTLALGLALLINQKLRFVNVFRTIYFSPVVTSMVVISVVWTFLYEDNGLINNFMTGLTFGLVGPFDWLGDVQSAMAAIIIMSVWQGVGFQMVIFLAGLQGIPDSLYEAAQIDGANRWQQFRNVTLPQLRNTIIFVAISTTILAFRLFTQVDVMTNGGPRDDATSTVVYHAVERGFRDQDIGYAAAISVVFFVIVLAISLIQRRVLRGQEG